MEGGLLVKEVVRYIAPPPPSLSANKKSSTTTAALSPTVVTTTTASRSMRNMTLKGSLKKRATGTSTSTAPPDCTKASNSGNGKVSGLKSKSQRMGKGGSIKAMGGGAGVNNGILNAERGGGSTKGRVRG